MNWVFAAFLCTALPHAFANGERVSGADSSLKTSLKSFRGFNLEQAYAWTWGDRAVLLIQLPLSDVYHLDGDVRLSSLPWRSLACLPEESLPEDAGLNAVAREATFLVITQAPEAKECVVNTVRGSELKGRTAFVAQLEHARVVECRDVSAELVRFGAAAKYVEQAGAVLAKPLPWDSRLDGASPSQPVRR